jgi:hypothetical protein
MIQFAEVFPDEQIVVSAIRQLSWTHFIALISFERSITERVLPVELLQLDKAGIKVAEYLTELPSKKTLKQKLHQAVELSRETLENRIKG